MILTATKTISKKSCESAAPEIKKTRRNLDLDCHDSNGSFSIKKFHLLQ